MCEIQFVMNPKGLSMAEKTAFIAQMNNGAYGNKDAWGVYFNGKIYKEYGSAQVGSKLFEQMKKQLLMDKTRFVLGHNRLATSGRVGNENNHPFETDHFVVVHNGMINNDTDMKDYLNLKYEEEVDSYIIPALLEHYHKQYSEEQLMKKVAESISGSFSIMIFVKATGNLYYFKNGSTYIYFRKSLDTIYISTSDESFSFESVDTIWSIPMQTGDIDDCTIYRIAPNGIVSKLMTFEEKKSVYSGYSYYSYGNNYSGYKYGNEKQQKRKLKDDIVEIIEAEGYPVMSSSKPKLQNNKYEVRVALTIGVLMDEEDMKTFRTAMESYPYMFVQSMKRCRKTTEIIMSYDEWFRENYENGVVDIYGEDCDMKETYNNLKSPEDAFEERMEREMDKGRTETAAIKTLFGDRTSEDKYDWDARWD